MREERRQKQGGGYKREIRRDFEEGGISRAGNNPTTSYTRYLYGYTHTHTYTYRLHRRSGGLAVEQTTTQALCRGVGGGQQDLKGSSNVALARHTHTHTHTPIH